MQQQTNSYTIMRVASRAKKKRKGEEREIEVGKKKDSPSGRKKKQTEERTV